jgi:hypothetical protein
VGEPATRTGSTQQRLRHRLFPALSLTLGQTLEQATAIATQGGSLLATLRNNGLASAFRNYVEVYRLTFSVATASYVWDVRDDGVGYWRRARVGERIAPDRQLARAIEVPPDPGSPSTGRRFRVGPSGYPDTFIGGEVVAELMGRLGTSSLAPTQAVELALEVPPLPPSAASRELTSWCVAFRCFELLTDPAPAVQLPTPPQPAHHAQLICLHSKP